MSYLQYEHEDEIPTITKAYAKNYLMQKLDHFTMVSCPSEVLTSMRDANNKLIKEVYYELHCQEIGI